MAEKNRCYKILRHTGVYCKKCGTIVYSRARHDMRSCPCGAVFIDGGFDYLKIAGNEEDFEIVSIRFKLYKGTKVESLKYMLWLDWNLSLDKYGHVKPLFSFLMKRAVAKKNRRALKYYIGVREGK